MYRRALSGRRGDAKLGHEALHDRKAHAAALVSAGGEHRRARLRHVGNAAAPVLDDDIEDASRQNPALERNCTDRVAVGVDDAVGHCLGDRSLDIAELIEIRVELRGKCCHCRARKALVSGLTGKRQFHLIFTLHVPCSFLQSPQCAPFRTPSIPSSAAAVHFPPAPRPAARACAGWRE